MGIGLSAKVKWRAGGSQFESFQQCPFVEMALVLVQTRWQDVENIHPRYSTYREFGTKFRSIYGN